MTADREFEDLKAGFQPEMLTAINPTIGNYVTAGRMAGEKAAKRLADHIAKKGKSPSAGAIVTYHAAAMESSCDKMSKAGAIEANLSAWRSAYVAALSEGMNALEKSR